MATEGQHEVRGDGLASLTTMANVQISARDKHAMCTHANAFRETTEEARRRRMDQIKINNIPL